MRHEKLDFPQADVQTVQNCCFLQFFFNLLHQQMILSSQLLLRAKSEVVHSLTQLTCAEVCIGAMSGVNTM